MTFLNKRFSLLPIKKCPADFYGMAIFFISFFSIWLYFPANASATSIRLTWDKNITETVAGYRIYYKAESEKSFTLIWDGAGVIDGKQVMHTFTGLSFLPGRTYIFVVSAYNYTGCESEFSDPVFYYSPQEASVAATSETTGDSTENTSATIVPSDNTSTDDYSKDTTSTADSQSTEEIASDTNSSNSVTSAASSTHPPDQPAYISPINNNLVNATILVLETSAFSDPDTSDTHALTQWQISTDSHFESLTLDTITSEFKTLFKVPDNLLEMESRYFWRVRYFDNCGVISKWSNESLSSDAFSFSTGNDKASSDSNQVNQEISTADASSDTDGVVNDPASSVSEPTEQTTRPERDRLTVTRSVVSFNIGKKTYGSPPDSPVPLSPSYGESIECLNPLLQTSFFNDPDSDYHEKTEWQISRNQDFSTLIFNATSTSCLTGLNVPLCVLIDDAKYFWRNRYYDNTGYVSSWSSESNPDDPSFFTAVFRTFVDSNDNGLIDDREVDGSIDLNEDGIPDNQQATMHTINADVYNLRIGIETENNSHLNMLMVIDESEIELEDNMPTDIPFGLVCFNLGVEPVGASTTVTIYFSESAPDDAIWYKFDPVKGWFDFSEHAFFSEDKKSVTLELQDGGYGDTDGTANGIIVDPSGIGTGPLRNPASSIDNSSSGGGCFIKSAFL